MKKRHGIFKRSKPENRTFRGIIFDSILDRNRAVELAARESEGLRWEPYPEFVLGVPARRRKLDFHVWTPAHPYLQWVTEHTIHGQPHSRAHCIEIPNGYVEEIKGPVQTGVRLLVSLWKACGPVPLVIRTYKKTGETVRVVVPDSMKPRKPRATP